MRFWKTRWNWMVIRLDGNQEENRGNLEKLEKRVTQLEADLEPESELFEERVGKPVYKKQQELSTRVNGLTQDEWNDLLRI